jgi:hypothetical protein
MFEPVEGPLVIHPGPKVCIYCGSREGKLTREHVIPEKLGGQIIIHSASCQECQKIINEEIETPLLTYMWVTHRHIAAMKTSRGGDPFRLGTFLSENGSLPADLSAPDVKFDWMQTTRDEYPTVMVMPIFLPPTLLRTGNRDHSPGFKLSKLDSWIDPATLPNRTPDGRKAMVTTPFDPSIVLREIAKIAHGFAVAVLGTGGFNPLLPPVILGRDKGISDFVGHSRKSVLTRKGNYWIRLCLEYDYIVCEVVLFSQFFRIPFKAVVGTYSPGKFDAMSTRLVFAGGSSWF